MTISHKYVMQDLLRTKVMFNEIKKKAAETTIEIDYLATQEVSLRDIIYVSTYFFKFNK